MAWNPFGKKEKPVLDTAPVEIPAEPEISQEEEKKKRKQDDSRRSRSEVLKLRLTPEEKQYIAEQAKSAGMNVTDYLVACSKQIPVVYIPGVPELVLELRRQGTNLNQMARLANERHDTRSIQLQMAAADARQARETIVEFCRKWDAQILDATKGKEVGSDGHNEAEPQ